MNILSGEEASVKKFASEYLRVVAKSGWLAFARALRADGLPTAVATVAAVADAAKGAVSIALDKSLSTLALERMTVLDPIPPATVGLAGRAAHASPEPTVGPSSAVTSIGGANGASPVGPAAAAAFAGRDAQVSPAPHVASA
jgi:hypothetical protein